jgi:EAL domain-containing protein (putative c-di-GMP-specific phosphodiesterase class I)
MCQHVLHEVSSRSGIALVLDDFGASTSSVRQLVEMSPAFVKLTVELVQGIDQSTRKRIAVKHVVQMCMDLGSQVIAKGIETDREARVLLDCGVAYGEGSLMGEATSLPSVSRWPGPR